MRFFTTAVTALCAGIVAAQNNAISVPSGESTLAVTAGQPLTLQWTNPSSGTVTIKLQQDPITPNGGITLASGVPASDGSATLSIPSGNQVNSHEYTIEIIDDTDTSNINFSPNFGIQGATGTASASASTVSTTGSATSSASATSSSGSTTSGSTSSASSATTTSSNSSSSTASSATTTSSSKSSTSSSATASASQTTSAPNTNSGATELKVQGAFIAAAAAMILLV
ncbi:hypothetical protein LTR10_017324 [Elasticomyces elasticus]|uniref:Uncharacterized protein n=1 Tax=Exophiala sideris TaxID=1016849 RepID=A0ABR0J9E6_9EURO|nr:hypothetical protein LTR10_017324 [Elasticomyces elasticus]KAK5027918.1 hypothetical protein LTS07_006794 [Exophiala sideris]KAK5037491.1 hypothetical protein LTR13_004648 [Exophiala sideris]KAK5059152.1 hypothetical protein LTR69_006441 [Exophiala sideris]KAK5182986.1 hypothetical protein LTR44_004696 [Eurotiomycetes sp. CCFEE 6388]